MNFQIRLQNEIPSRAGAMLVWLGGIKDWDIGWHDGKNWHSRTFGDEYPVMFWMNLPPTGWIANCLMLEESKGALEAIRRSLADACAEKNKHQNNAKLRRVFHGHNRIPDTLKRQVNLKSNAKPRHHGSRRQIFQLPLESYLNVLYGSR